MGKKYIAQNETREVLDQAMFLLPTINASFNLLSAILLVLGLIAIKKHDLDQHKKIMGMALLSSACFLTGYLVHHALHGSTPYPHGDGTRIVYYSILIPHVILAAVMVPFIIRGVYLGLKDERAKHKKLMRWVWPVWFFVSVSGLVVYAMLYL